MGVEFRLTKEQPAGKPGIAIIRLAGWLDAQSEARLVEAVQRAKQEGATHVLLDLADVDTVTSAGIRAMQKSYQILTPKGVSPKSGFLKLCNASPQVYQVLNVTGLLMQIPVYESQDIAVDSFDT
jgi:stage II sporulation protein AA (anti-sigma F factor antagonist)